MKKLNSEEYDKIKQQFGDPTVSEMSEDVSRETEVSEIVKMVKTVGVDETLSNYRHILDDDDQLLNDVHGKLLFDIDISPSTYIEFLTKSGVRKKYEELTSEDYEKAEQFFNGETKWRDTWAEQSPSKDYETFAKRAGELMKAGVEKGLRQAKKWTFLDDGDDWGRLQKVQQLKPDQSIKFDEGKPRPSLVPQGIISGMAKVREYGLNKYGDKESWRMVDIDRYVNALYRHVLAVADGEWLDSESGLPHVDHIAVNAAFIRELKEE